MQLPPLTAEAAVSIASAIAALGIAYDSAEVFVAHDLVVGGFFDWRIIRSRYYIFLGRPLLGGIFDLLLGEKRIFQGLVLAHGLAALAFPFAIWQHEGVAAVLAAIVLLVHCLSNIRVLVGRDGADQMQTIFWAGMLGYSLPVPDWVRLVALGFVVAQLVLSYLISGLAKAASPIWRRGQAIALITRMATYCPQEVSARLAKPAVSFFASWATIVFELIGPFLLLAGPWGTAAFMLGGAAFHIGIAMTMGLTTFVFAFLAVYPLVYYLVQRLS